MLGSYTYRPDGLRHSKTANGLTLTHLWDGNQMAAELNGTTVYSRYVRGLELIKSTKFGFYLYNGRGDVVQLTNGNGTKTRDYLYDAFGNQSAAASDDANPFRYCGEYFDKETETVYLRARYYRASTGRFTSQDSADYMNQSDPLSLNLYTYCGNNPVAYSDPSGHSIEDAFVGAITALDENIAGGFCKWIVQNLLGNRNNYQYDDASDYYLGRIVGDALGIAYGAGTSILGIIGIIASIGTGGAITVASGGTLAAGGVSVAVAGVTVGAGAVTVGGTVMCAAVDNIGNDVEKYNLEQEFKKIFETPTSNSKEFIKLKGDQGYKDKKGDIWKKDKLHKDHWDVCDKKGNKIMEIDFGGKQIWPNGPKNKNK